MLEPLDRREIKESVRELLQSAQVSPKSMTALYMGLSVVLSLISLAGGGGNALYSLMTGGMDTISRTVQVSLFVSVLTWLIGIVLDAGFLLYCMSVLRREQAEYRVLFDGFAMVGRIVTLELLCLLFISLWSMFFVIPGIIAAYRYRFALPNLLENPELGILDAIRMSRLQTQGFKFQLFLLDLSFLGWFLLGSIPEILYDGVIQYRVLSGLTNIAAGPLGLPYTVWNVVIIVFPAVVALFYLARYRCADLEYFDAAKRVSGIGESPQEGGGLDIRV